MLSFPFITVSVELLFKAQAFRFHASRALIIPFHARQFFLRFQAVEFRFRLFQFRRHGIKGNAKFRGSLIHQVNCFIRQTPVGHVSRTELNRSSQSFIREMHLMVRFVAVAQPLQHFQCVFLRRFLNKNRRETSF